MLNFWNYMAETHLVKMGIPQRSGTHSTVYRRNIKINGVEVIRLSLVCHKPQAKQPSHLRRNDINTLVCCSASSKSTNACTLALSTPPCFSSRTHHTMSQRTLPFITTQNISVLPKDPKSRVMPKLWHKKADIPCEHGWGEIVFLSGTW